MRRLYSEEEYCQPLIKEISRDDSFVESSSISTSKPTITNDLMADLYSNEESGSVNEESEIDRYIQEPIQRRKCDPLTWWRDNADKYPTLSKLAQKYLLVPAMLVPSKCVFSDAGLHITALHNRLHPDMVEQMMFLKRNKQHFPIFRPNEL